MSGGGGGGGGSGVAAHPTGVMSGLKPMPGLSGLQAGGGAPALRLTPEMLGLSSTSRDAYGEGPISSYGAGVMQLPGQNLNFYGGSTADIQNALALAHMYSNLNRLGYTQPQGGTPMPQAAPAPAPMPQPTMAPPPTGPSVPAMTPLMPYTSMLGQVRGINTQRLPANMAAAIPAYLRRRT